MTHHSIQWKLAEDDCAINNIMRKMARENDDAQRNWEVVCRTLFANRSRREINDNTMTRKMQTRILYSSLHTLTTLLHCCIRQANNRHPGQTIGVVHLNFDDDAFQPNHRTWKYACKHAGSLDDPD